MATSQKDLESVVCEVRIAARPETIFDFFVDPEKMIQWKGMTADLDPRPGGRYHVDITATDVAVGEYVVIDPPRRVVFTWGWEQSSEVPPGSSTVEIVLTPEGSETLVTLTHSDLPSGAGSKHGEGWDHYLPRLAMAAAGNDPGVDPWTKTEGD